MTTTRSLVFSLFAVSFLGFSLSANAQSGSGRLDTGDVSFALVGRTLHPDVSLSYFDHEDNSPFKGDARSRLIRLQTDAVEDDKTIQRFTFQFTFDLAAGYGHYLGWYFAIKQDAVDFSDKTNLVFEMKGTPGLPVDDFFIGVRSINVPAEDNNAKVSLADLGVDQFPDDYTKIEVPVSLLLEREPELDLARMNDLLLFAIVSPQEEVKDQSIWLRNVSWDWGVEKTKDGFVARLPNLHFDTGRADLKPEMNPILNRLLEALKAFPEKRFLVVGHTDNVGTRAFNQHLSQRRARSVANYMIRTGRIPPGRVFVEGRGMDEPIAPNDTESGRALNRRVDVLIQ